MATYLFIIAFSLLLAYLIVSGRARRNRRTAIDRLSEEDVIEEVVEVIPQGTVVRSRRWAAFIVGIVLGVLTNLIFRLPLIYCVSVGVIAAVIVGLVDAWLYGKKILRLDTQLADAIDLMVGSLNAGASAMDSMHLAAKESARPLRPLLDEISGRVRLGDSPQALLHELAERVPLQTFRLFCFTMSVHWEVGGSLAPILSGVGRSVRDRIELSRRIRSQRANAQMSVIGILLISYFVALIMWKTNPVRTEIFLNSRVGGTLVALSVVMQAIGMVWMTRLSRIRL